MTEHIISCYWFLEQVFVSRGPSTVFAPFLYACNRMLWTRPMVPIWAFQDSTAIGDRYCTWRNTRLLLEAEARTAWNKRGTRAAPRNAPVIQKRAFRRGAKNQKIRKRRIVATTWSCQKRVNPNGVWRTHPCRYPLVGSPHLPEIWYRAQLEIMANLKAWFLLDFGK